MTEAVVIRTPLSPSECRHRLEAYVQQATFINSIDWSVMVRWRVDRDPDRQPMLGEFRGDALKLTLRAVDRNPLQPHFIAAIGPSGTGAVIRGTFETPGLIVMKGFVIIAVALVPLLGAAAVSSVAAGDGSTSVQLLAFAVLFNVMVFGLRRFFRVNAERQRASILARVSRVVEGTRDCG